MYHSTFQHKVREFHEAMGLDMDLGVSVPRIREFGGKLREEMQELIEALNIAEYGCDSPHPPANRFKRHAALLKELMDVTYCCMSICTAFGWNADLAFTLVHVGNMSKLVDGKPIRDPVTGWVQKGPNYRKPNLEDLV